MTNLISIGIIRRRTSNFIAGLQRSDRLFEQGSHTRTMKFVDLIRLKSSCDKIPLFPSKSPELTVDEPTTSKQFLKADFDWLNNRELRNF